MRRITKHIAITVLYTSGVGAQLEQTAHNARGSRLEGGVAHQPREQPELEQQRAGASGARLVHLLGVEPHAITQVHLHGHNTSSYNGCIRPVELAQVTPRTHTTYARIGYAGGRGEGGQQAARELVREREQLALVVGRAQRTERLALVGGEQVCREQASDHSARRTQSQFCLVVEAKREALRLRARYRMLASNTWTVTFRSNDTVAHSSCTAR